MPKRSTAIFRPASPSMWSITSLLAVIAVCLLIEVRASTSTALEPVNSSADSGQSDRLLAVAASRRGEVAQYRIVPGQIGVVQGDQRVLDQDGDLEIVGNLGLGLLLGRCRATEQKDQQCAYDQTPDHGFATELIVASGSRPTETARSSPK